MMSLITLSSLYMRFKVGAGRLVVMTDSLVAVRTSYSSSSFLFAISEGLYLKESLKKTQPMHH